MIHEHIAYGYNWDDETKTLIAHENLKTYGMFSTFTLMLISIIAAYKKHNTIVENFNYSNIMHRFKWSEDIDMYSHFFKFNKNAKIDINPHEIPIEVLYPDHQHLIYKKENSKFFQPFFEKYFLPSEIIENKIIELRKKYNIDSENSISVIYRDSDKWTDMGAGFLSTQAGVYFRNTKNLIEKITNKTNNRPFVLLQTENPGVVRTFREGGLNSIYFEETKLDKDQSIYPPVITKIELMKDWIESYFAALWIHSQSKHVITYTGNSAFFIYLMRGNTENFYQEKTFLMNPNDFFVFNA